ncbi:MAG: hypothetical protein ABI647_26845 [Gemmatimonadota bacterium]
MRPVLHILLALSAAISIAATAQTPAAPVTAIRASRMLDVKSGTYVANPVILIQRGRITAAGRALPCRTALKWSISATRRSCPA